jgi:hypothetical protein
MITSEQINELAAALAKAQGEFPAIPKDCVAKVTTKAGGSYSFKYADLDTILATVRPVLAKHGISMMVDIQNVTDRSDRAVKAIIRIMHGSQWIETSGFVISIDADAYARQPAQASGSAATYATRYAIEAALAIRASDDDDGAGASGNQIDVQRRPPPQPAPQQTGTRPALHDSLRSLLQEFHWLDEYKKPYSEKLLGWFDSSLDRCMDDPEHAAKIAQEIEAELRNFPNTNRLEQLQTLFASIMEKPF